MSKIIIVDTGSSNILSLKKAVEIFDNNVEVTTNSNKILSADKILFPGVGAFKKVMDNLEKNKLTETLMKTREKKIPLLVELETSFKILSFKPGEIHFDLTSDANLDLVSSLSKFLKNFTNLEWNLIRLKNTNAKTLSNLKEEEDMKLRRFIDQNDIVQEIIKIFPGSKIAKSSFH